MGYLDSRLNEGTHPLHYYAYFGGLEKLRQLLRRNRVNINQLWEGELTPLHAAIEGKQNA